MSCRRALITGITGQDGSYLAQALLEQGYEVLGLLEAGRSSSLWNLDYLGVLPRIRLLKATLADSVEVQRVLLETKPTEIYSLAAQSSVSASFREPALTMTANTQPVLNWLEAIRSLNPSIRLYHASSSEMYGNVDRACVTPTTLFNPISPYAVSKVAAHQLVRAYRNAYGLYAVSGILFNHESALRKVGFFTRKLMDGALGLASRQITGLSFGNLDVRRDFGYAPDYVEAMWLMLRQSEPEDHLICSGHSVSLQEIVAHVFRCLNISIEALHIDSSLYRPAEIQDIYGTPDYAASKLGWRSSNTAFQTMERILEERLAMQQRGQRLPA
ncbi:MAG: GDP-mannose 4,6-dehydratase [Synechococcaceae cyanobacterium]|nr:GDP-mannose 4,6-dehydratase [Synechococcaceae cyanobacterium]